MNFLMNKFTRLFEKNIIDLQDDFKGEEKTYEPFRKRQFLYLTYQQNYQNFMEKADEYLTALSTYPDQDPMDLEEYQSYTRKLENFHHSKTLFW